MDVEDSNSNNSTICHHENKSKVIDNIDGIIKASKSTRTFEKSSIYNDSRRKQHRNSK